METGTALVVVAVLYFLVHSAGFRKVVFVLCGGAIICTAAVGVWINADEIRKLVSSQEAGYAPQQIKINAPAFDPSKPFERAVNHAPLAPVVKREIERHRIWNGNCKDFVNVPLTALVQCGISDERGVEILQIWEDKCRENPKWDIQYGVCE